MELELALRLRAHRDHPRVVRARAHLGEPDLVALDEELDAEDAAAAELAGHARGDVVGALAAPRADIGCGCHDST